MKTHYLGRKCNQCVNCIVCTLVFKVVPDFDFKHRQQITKIEGQNLEDSHHWQIKASTRNISPDSIHYVGSTTFYVASQSHPGNYYLIDITQSACNCNDFPRIWYYKHIAAVNVHFSQLCPKGNSFSEIPEHMHISDLPECMHISNLPECICIPDLPECMHVPNMPECKHTPRSEEESTETILKDINMLYQQLSTVSNCLTLDLQNLKVIKYSLKMVITLANGSWALPKKDLFNPNQKTWAEIAKCMGSAKAPKCQHPSWTHTTTIGQRVFHPPPFFMSSVAPT